MLYMQWASNGTWNTNKFIAAIGLWRVHDATCGEHRRLQLVENPLFQSPDEVDVWLAIQSISASFKVILVSGIFDKDKYSYAAILSQLS